MSQSTHTASREGALGAHEAGSGAAELLSSKHCGKTTKLRRDAVEGVHEEYH